MLLKISSLFNNLFAISLACAMLVELNSVIESFSCLSIKATASWTAYSIIEPLKGKL